jgi:hypothetical protein
LWVSSVLSFKSRLDLTNSTILPTNQTPPMKSNCFHPFTRAFCSDVGDMTSFIWASYAGLWSIYKSGTELARLSSAPEWKKIANHLTSGIPDQGGIDLKVITSKPWSDHQGTYTNFILTQGAILYEEWTGRLADSTATTGKKVKAETYQFPSGTISSKCINWSALDLSGAIATSPFLTSEVQPKLLTTHATNIANLDALLKWYRYFKELRNSIAHNGGAASQRAIDAYNAASAVTLSNAGMNRDLTSSAPVLGKQVSIPLADAVLFLGLIQRLAFAFDAKYCSTTHAEIGLKARIQSAAARNPPPIEATAQRKQAWIKNFLNHKANVTVTSLHNAESWLKTNGLVSIRQT